MEGFVYAAQPVPLGGESNFGFLNLRNRYTGKKIGENNFDGGDPGLQYRFWDQQADSGYSASDINEAEEQAFLGLENLFACRKQCKSDLGGAANLRDCIRSCKGKGLRKSALKTKEAQTQEELAKALTKMAEPGQEPANGGGKNVMLWVVVGFMALVIIGLLIYFLTRKKAVPVAECGAAVGM